MSLIENKVFLYVPAYKPNFIENAIRINDKLNIILCLEDGTPDANKLEARYLVKHAANEYFKKTGKKIIVRINAIESDIWKEDIKVTIDSKKVSRIRVPKVSKPEDIILIERYIESLNCNLQYEIMIESKIALDNIEEISKSSKCIYAFTFGASDYELSIRNGSIDIRSDLLNAREKLGGFCRENNFECFDSTFMNYKETELFKIDCEFSQKVGFTGRSVIHPLQIDIANKIYSVGRI